MVRSFLLILLLASATAFAEIPPGGFPRAADLQQLDNPGFSIGYSDARREALWVEYEAHHGHWLPYQPRQVHFRPDPRLQEPVDEHDYYRSRYDRGHLAPAYLIGRLYGAEAEAASFLLSNVAPQRKRLNELVWQRLEESEADFELPRLKQIWVITGPVFSEKPHSIGPGIAVPEAFYRVWLHRGSGARWQALGFIVPQNVCGTEPLENYVTPVAEIERRTAVKLFPNFDPVAHDALDAADTREKDWKISGFSHWPARYGDDFDLSRCPR